MVPVSPIYTVPLTSLEGVGFGVAAGFGVAFGVGLGVAAGFLVAAGAFAEGEGDGEGVGITVGVGDGDGVGVTVAVGDGVGVGKGVAEALGVCAGAAPQAPKSARDNKRTTDKTNFRIIRLPLYSKNIVPVDTYVISAYHK